MKNKIIFSITICFLIALASCRKDSTISEIEITPPDTVIKILAKATGFVTDLDGNVLEGVSVRLDNEEVFTDVNGFFNISGYANSKNGVLHISSPGYFDAYQAITPVENEYFRTTVKLFKRVDQSTISSSTGGEVEVHGGGKVIFQSDGFMDDMGNDYNGEVAVFSTFINPDDLDFYQKMAGARFGKSTDGKAQILLNFGMSNIELDGSAGQKLQLKKPATIEVPIPFPFNTNAPEQIPLWFFDTKSDEWKEEGIANRVGDNYIAEVSHFTFWTCATSQDFIQLSGTVKVDDFTPELVVRITQLDNGDSRHTTTNNVGFYAGKVPKDKELGLEILDKCGNSLHFETIGMFTSDTDIGQLNLDMSAAGDWIQITGDAVDCQNNAVTNGFIVTSTSNPASLSNFPIQTDGVVNNIIADCGAPEVTIFGVDYDANKVSFPNIFPTNNLIDVGTLQVCDQLTPLAILNYDGNEVTFTDGVTVDIIPQGDTILYRVKILDNQPSGDSEYTLDIRDENADPSNPNYTMTSSSCQILSGAPDPHYGFVGSDFIEHENYTNQLGEILVFNITGQQVYINGAIVTNVGSSTSLRIQASIN